MLALLNSRNCVSIDKAEVSTGNKLRRLRGKPPLLSHSTVNIHLNKRDARASEAMSPAEVRLHMVRGHFKVRKSGVFFWRPHLRGDADFGEVVHDKYAVVQ